MSESMDYARDSITTWVWSGFYDKDEVAEMLEDILEGDEDEEALRDFISAEFERKRAAEAGWPEKTDCDRLDAAFARLQDERIVAIQNAGYTMDDGFGEVDEVLRPHPRGAFRGYCFYHGQDLERAVAGRGLMLAFADLREEEDAKREVGELVARVVREAGLDVHWDGNTNNRIQIEMDWKRRYRPD